MVIRKDQKTAVIGHQMKPIILMAKVPAYPAIPCCTLQGRCGKTYKGDPLIVPADHIPQGLSDLGQSPQVMMLLHKHLIVCLLGRANRAHNDFFQVQDDQPLRDK